MGSTRTGVNHRSRGLVRRYADGAVMAFAAVLAVVLGARAATPSNAQSPLGINLQSVSYWSSEQPFLNSFKTSNGWISHSAVVWDTAEEKYLNLDSDGWPKTLTVVGAPGAQKFNSLGIVVFRDLPQSTHGYYPSGQYVVLYDGQGTFSYGFDAVLVSSAPGRDVITVAHPSTIGMDLRITSTDPSHTGNYIRNVRLVKAESEAALKAGQVFAPAFLGLLKNFHALRFMDWSQANGNPLSSWSDRPLPSNAFWGTAKGVPIEVAVQLANAISADAWLTVPVMADDNYLKQMAALVNQQLGTVQKAYVELSNEVWNASFPQNAYSIARGQAQFPSVKNKWVAGLEWYGMRVAQMSDIWYGIYGSSAFKSRVVIVMAGQAANTAVLQQELATPDWTGAGKGPAITHHIGVAAIAPYFFSTPNSADIATLLAAPDGGLAEIFTTVSSRAGLSSVPSGGSVAETNRFTAAHVKLLAPYGLSLAAYEGGQSMASYPNGDNNSAAAKLFIAVNRDPRMVSAYTTYLNAWKSNGGTLFMHYTDSFPPSQYGEWGALESFMQSTDPLSSAPPKWQALQNFISGNACWWAKCAAAVVPSTLPPVPKPPTSLTVR